MGAAAYSGSVEALENCVVICRANVKRWGCKTKREKNIEPNSAKASLGEVRILNIEENPSHPFDIPCYLILA